MHLDHYKIETGKKALTYEFLSTGRKGNIRKAVQSSLIDKAGFYNLAFGDLNSDTGDIDDLTITDNGDSEKVLATVVSAIYAFCDLVPQAWIYAAGSTPARTRLYRMGIHKYFDIASRDFEIFGQTADDWQPFVKGNNYAAFLVHKKRLHLIYGKGR